jgi:hypothetical protein
MGFLSAPADEHGGPPPDACCTPGGVGNWPKRHRLLYLGGMCDTAATPTDTASVLNRTTLRLPRELLASVHARARDAGVSSAEWIRRAIEAALGGGVAVAGGGVAPTPEPAPSGVAATPTDTAATPSDADRHRPANGLVLVRFSAALARMHAAAVVGDPAGYELARAAAAVLAGYDPEAGEVLAETHREAHPRLCVALEARPDRGALLGAPRSPAPKATTLDQPTVRARYNAFLGRQPGRAEGRTRAGDALVGVVSKMSLQRFEQAREDLSPEALSALSAFLDGEAAG